MGFGLLLVPAAVQHMAQARRELGELTQAKYVVLSYIYAHARFSCPRPQAPSSRRCTQRHFVIRSHPLGGKELPKEGAAVTPDT
jgi:hypothetical protein